MGVVDQVRGWGLKGINVCIYTSYSDSVALNFQILSFYFIFLFYLFVLSFLSVHLFAIPLRSVCFFVSVSVPFVQFCTIIHYVIFLWFDTLLCIV